MVYRTTKHQEVIYGWTRKVAICPAGTECQRVVYDDRDGPLYFADSWPRMKKAEVSWMVAYGMCVDPDLITESSE